MSDELKGDRQRGGGSALGVLAALATALVCGPAVAQEPVLEEIVVTAQKREQSAQEIALSITAFSGDDLQAFGITQAKDLASQVPGLFAKTTLGDSAPTFTIRGVGLNDFVSNNNSPTSIYLDDVYQPFHPMTAFALFDIARVEVLKGPQGTLYGRNNTGGAIKFVANRPSDAPSGHARLSYGRFEALEAEAALGGALGETLNGRIALFTKQGGEYQQNRLTGRELGESDRVAGRVMLDWQPSDSLDVLLNLHGGTDKGENQQFKLANSQDPANTFVPCPAAFAGRLVYDGSCTDLVGFFEASPDRWTVSGENAGFPEGPRRDNSGYGGSLTVDWQLARTTLTSVTGYDRYERSEGVDADGSPNLLADGRYDDTMDAISQEIRLTSDDTWGIDWIAGVYYSSDSIDILQRLQSDDFLPLLTGIPGPIAAWQDFEQDTESYAAFAHVEWPVTDRITLIGGLRATHETKEFSGGSRFVTAAFGDIPLASTDDEIDADDVSGKIGINFEPNDDWLLYASLSKGFKSGGFNAAFSSDPRQLQPFDPEELYALEAGWKATLLDGSMVLNGAAYFYDWRDFQAQIVSTSGGVPIQILSNAGDAEVLGFEAEWTWAATERLDLNLALNYTNSEVVSGQLEGLELANTPEFSTSGWARYEYPFESAGIKLFGQADFSYRTEVTFRLNAVTGLSVQDDYGLANLRLGLGSLDDRMSLTFWVQNLTEEEYLVDAFEQLPINTLHVWGAPRTWGATFSYSFF